ncbi:putative endonuclease 4 [Babylonia areolata]|uniref:putative endonuclease 4 n=1 Tax=Babylonia areolata TaxID=304850 RepID=UPI003FD57D72
MARKKKSNKRTAQTDKNQVKTEVVEAEDANLSETKDSDIEKSTSVDHKDKDGTVPEKQQPAKEDVVLDRSTAKRQKRKSSHPQAPESDSPDSKRQRISTAAASQTTNKRQSNRTSQNSKQTSRRQLRSRIKKSSELQQSTASFTKDKKDVSESKTKTKRKLTEKSSAGDCDQAPSTAVDTDIAMKKEIKHEAVSAQTTTKDARKLVGAHCSIAGGLHKAVEEAVAMGGQAFGLFLRSQRSWASKPLDPKAADKFKASCKEHGFPPNSILPHGSYLMNCGSPNPETLKKSRESLLEELQRCEALGLTLYNFHPGSTCGEISVEQCLDSIADAINWAHQHTKFVITVVENMSCQGNTVGGRFEELKGIIDRVKDKSRIGICLDTCHAFAAGYDLSSKQGFEKFMSDFDTIVGFQYLKAMHLNDSKGGVGCHLDRHENIGKGKIGLGGFRRVMAEPRFDGIPMILETPLGDYAAEIKALNGLVQ